MLKISLSLLVVFVLFVTHAHALDENAPRWNPMWEVAWLPMAIRVSELGEDEKKYGLTEKMLHDAVELRLRANSINTALDAFNSPMPHIFVMVHSLGISGPGLDGVFYTVNFNVRDPVILDCDSGGYVLASIWSYEYMGFEAVEEYPEEALRVLSGLADAFSLEYLRASEQVPNSLEIHANRLANQYACQAL